LGALLAAFLPMAAKAQNQCGTTTPGAEREAENERSRKNVTMAKRSNEKPGSKRLRGPGVASGDTGHGSGVGRGDHHLWVGRVLPKWIEVGPE